MYIENQTTLIRHNIKTAIAELFMEDRLNKDIDRLPIRMVPHDSESYRCCVYKDRELIKKRVIAALGFSLEEDEHVEDTLLSDYAEMALEREKPTFPILTFLDEACRTCVRANYFVTNVCRHCVARPCLTNCPKNAISMKDQAFIHPDLCVNCGICKNVCPYHAIVYIPVPCEEGCPVGAISKNKQGRQQIDYSKCIFCGRCTRACPFGAVLEKSQILDVLKAIRSGKQVTAMIAPAVVGQFNATIDQIAAGLKLIGFSHVVEVALGADLTTKVEAEEFIERMEKGDKVMGTSCCPAYIEAVKKHATNFIPFVSHTKTPMGYTAEMIKEAFPESVRVFIGPCIAKKHEGLFNPDVDFALTFEALSALYEAKGIIPEELEQKPSLDLQQATRIGRSFPVSNGVANAIVSTLDGKIDIKPILINGLTKQNVKLLNAYASKCPGNLVEIMSCEGGCVGGPGVIMEQKKAKQRIDEFVKGCDE